MQYFLHNPRYSPLDIQNLHEHEGGGGAWSGMVRHGFISSNKLRGLNPL